MSSKSLIGSVSGSRMVSKPQSPCGAQMIPTTTSMFPKKVSLDLGVPTQGQSRRSRKQRLNHSSTNSNQALSHDQQHMQLRCDSSSTNNSRFKLLDTIPNTGRHKKSV